MLSNSTFVSFILFISFSKRNIISLSFRVFFNGLIRKINKIGIFSLFNIFLPIVFAKINAMRMRTSTYQRTYYIPQTIRINYFLIDREIFIISRCNSHIYNSCIRQFLKPIIFFQLGYYLIFFHRCKIFCPFFMGMAQFLKAISINIKSVQVIQIIQLKNFNSLFKISFFSNEYHYFLFNSRKY